MRLLLGLCWGVSLGLRSVEGGLGIISGIGLIYFVPLLYVETFLKADLESYKTPNLNMTGVVNAIALLILAWATLYTWNNPDLLEQVVRASGDAVSSGEPTMTAAQGKQGATDEF